MKVVLRTHGGLGNQIFQILFARLYAEQCGATLHEIHDANYPHRFARSTELKMGMGQISDMQKLFSSLRLPKVLHRMGWSKSEKISLFGTVYLDGYFQAAFHYKLFNTLKIAEHLISIRDELKISQENKRGHLVHLRLGDFFSSTDLARLHAIERLSELRTGATIITNQEGLLKEPKLQSMLDKAGCEIQTTEGYSAEEIIRLMTQFNEIDANDSTLTFWSSVLGECDVKFRNPELIETLKLFKSCLAR